MFRLLIACIIICLIAFVVWACIRSLKEVFDTKMAEPKPDIDLDGLITTLKIRIKVAEEEKLAGVENATAKLEKAKADLEEVVAIKERTKNI